jgi:speckle-type POZ protein
MLLSARSKYFETMFESAFKEAKDKVIKIEDDEKIFKLMIKIIYTNDISELTFENALDLIVLVNKYIVDELRMACEKILVRSMVIANCIDVLLAADAIDSDEFMEKTINFVSANIKQVMKTEKWELLKAQKPNLAFEITTKLLK